MSDAALTADDFPAFFEAVHSVAPFPWQLRLLNLLAETGSWPPVLDLPTGAGKTAALDIAVFHLALEAAKATDRQAPIRIAFVVDRRLIVDDTFERARKIEAALAAPRHEIVRRAAAALRLLAGKNERPLVARRLRGGAPREDDWARTPAQPTILCSTVDQVGSRLLFRGYGVSDRMKPIHAGLLGSDCLVLLDEAHLAEPFRQTLDSIKRLRGEDSGPWQFALLSATPGVPSETSDKEHARFFALDDNDRINPVLAKRLAVSKPTTLIEVAGKPAEDRRIDALVEHTMATLAALRPDAASPAIGVVVNRVARARAVFERVKGQLPDATTLLIIGPARPIEREQQAARDLLPIRTGRPRDLDRPLIVVATQTIEAGVDIDFDGLVTEAAALDALRQRFGRLNRAGRPVQSVAVILAHKEDIGPRVDDPVYGDRIGKTWEALKQAAEETAEKRVEFGIDGFPRQLADKIGELAAEKPDAPVLMPAYADLWSQTSPIPNADPDASLFLHGPNRSPASVQIVWRADIAEGELVGRNRYRLATLLDLVPPRSAEAIEVPIWAARAWLRGRSEPAAGLADIAERELEDQTASRRDRPVFRYAGSRDEQRTGIVFPNQLRPGDLIVVPATYGGCDEWGWDPVATERQPTTDLAERAAEPYAARHFAVRVTPELIYQGLSEEGGGGDPTFPLAAVREALAALLAEHRDDKTTDLLDAVLGMRSLSGRLRQQLEMIKNRCKGRLVRAFPYDGDDQEASRGVIFIAIHGVNDADRVEDLAAVPATEDDDLGSASGKAQLLDEHSKKVKDRARQFAVSAGLLPKIAEDVALAAYLHDAGKIDPRFQAYLAGGDPLAADPRKVLAKSGRASLRGARDRAGLPENWRHEALSVRLAQLHPGFVKANDPALVLWLVGVHHGFGRPLFPHADPRDGERRTDLPPALGVEWQIEAGQGPQSLAFDFNGRDWAQIFADLKDRYGIWGLARLEAILRLADHRASEDTEFGQRIVDCVPAERGNAVGRPASRHRLEGLEPDNLLAFLALLGLLRVLETVRPEWRPRAAWAIENPPVRPILFIAEEVSQDALCTAAAEGAESLLAGVDFGAVADLKLTPPEARELLRRAYSGWATPAERYFVDLCAALICDQALDREQTTTAPSPLTYPTVARINFLQGLRMVATTPLPDKRNRARDPKYPKHAIDCIAQALFTRWERLDRPPGLRWDPEEGKRHAYQWNAPTNEQPTTQHGANRLAIIGLSVLLAVPTKSGAGVRLLVVGGNDRRNDFVLAWPVWKPAASLSAIRALLSHPGLQEPGALDHLGVDHVRIAKRISLDRYRNFTYAQPLQEA